MNCTVYVIWNTEHGRYYVGQTADLEKRMAEQNDPENFSSKFTKKFSGQWILLHQEQYPDRPAAIRRERELKTGKGRDWLNEQVLPHESRPLTKIP